MSETVKTDRISDRYCRLKVVAKSVQEKQLPKWFIFESAILSVVYAMLWTLITCNGHRIKNQRIILLK